MFVFREGLQFRVFSLECLVVLFRQLLQMLSGPFVRCDPHSCQPHSLGISHSGFCPELSFNSLFSLSLQLRTSKNRPRICRDHQQEHAGDCQVRGRGSDPVLQLSGTCASDLFAFTSRTVVRSIVAVANKKQLLSRTFG